MLSVDGGEATPTCCVPKMTVAFESIAFGFRLGLRVLSLTMLALGLIVALLLWQAAKGLRAPQGAGYT